MKYQEVFSLNWNHCIQLKMIYQKELKQVKLQDQLLKNPEIIMLKYS